MMMRFESDKTKLDVLDGECPCLQENIVSDMETAMLDATPDSGAMSL